MIASRNDFAAGKISTPLKQRFRIRIVLVTLTCVLLTTAAAVATTLRISVSGVRSNKGTINICVYDHDHEFPDCSKQQKILARQQPATIGIVRFDLDVEPGLHAVTALHDENNNGKLDTNFLGIPLEGVGVSNNPPPRRGPPLFKEAQFSLPPRGGEIVVNLVYP